MWAARVARHRRVNGLGALAGARPPGWECTWGALVEIATFSKATSPSQPWVITMRLADARRMARRKSFSGLLFNRISQASRAPRAHAVAVGSFVDLPSIAQTCPLRCG